MSYPATEIAILPFSPGANIENSSSPASRSWRSVLDTIAAQEGFQRIYWGRQIEFPNLVDFFVDWDSVQSHQDYIASPAYGELLKIISPLLDNDVLVYHTHFSPNPPSTAFSITSASVAEHLTFYFPSTMSDADRSSWDETFAKFKKLLEQHAEGFKTGVGGWVVEELHHQNVEGTAKAFAAVFEWESVAKHKAFRDTEEFKKAIGPVRNASKGIDMHHVVLMIE